MEQLANVCRRPRGAWLLPAAWLIAACAGTQAPPPAEPQQTQSAAYPGRCELVGLDMVEAPTDRVSGDTGSVQLVATYRAGERAGKSPLTLSFRVKRERVEDLRAQLEQHPTVLCNPGAEGAEHGAVLQVPPFEGQAGTPGAQ